MAISDLMFWRRPKEKEAVDLSDIDKELAELEKTGTASPTPGGLGMTGLAQPALQSSQPTYTETPVQPSFQQYPQPVQQPSDTRKDLELISTKIDALRSSIEVINRRLETIESLMRGEYEEKKKSWRYN